MKTEIPQRLAAFLFACMLFAAASCGRDPGPVRSTSHFRMMDDTLINYNKGISRNEDQEIMDYTTRYGWDVLTTSTGVRYLIYKQGTGMKVEKGAAVTIRYDLKLLTGKHIYSSDSMGPKEFAAGYGEVEAGLQEAVMLMRQGDRAKVIIPSRLGHGLLGDGKKIPPGATLVYDVEVTGVKPPKEQP